jgi:predicted flap endonuclease-1-like 5' DNA nuclease
MDNLIQLAMQIIFCLLIAAILGAIIGYFLGKIGKCEKEDHDLDINIKDKELNDYDSNTYETQPRIVETPAPIAHAGAIGAGTYENIKDTLEESKKVSIDFDSHTAVGQEIGIRPESLESPLDGEIDDLKEVSGIGLKIEEVLNSLGIYYFDQIAAWTPENIEWIENYLSVKRRVKKEDWIGQAKLLAAGSRAKLNQK